MKSLVLQGTVEAVDFALKSIQYFGYHLPRELLFIIIYDASLHVWQHDRRVTQAKKTNDNWVSYRYCYVTVLIRYHVYGDCINRQSYKQFLFFSFLI